MNKKQILHPKPITILFLIISTIFLLIYSLGNEKALDPIKYFSYLYSSFSLIIVCFNIGRFYRFIKDKVISSKGFNNIKNTLYKNKYIERYFEDIKYNNLINLYISTIFNFFFILINFINGFNNKSIWFISLSIYYTLLTVIKFILLNSFKNGDIKYEYKVYRNTGYFIMLFNLLLVGMIIQMILSNVATVYGGYIIYMNALYTFYLIISAIVNLIKYRKYNSPILSSVKCINFLTASVSVLMLQTTMIATFSEDNFSFQKLMNTITGLVISIITLTISTYMILRGQKQLNGK